MLPIFIVAICLVVFAPFAHAQERITEQEFLSQLRGGHPALRALLDRTGAARADRVRAGLFSNPVASLQHEGPRNVAEQTTWLIAWTPPLDGRRGPAIKAADAGVRAAIHELDASRLDLRVQMRAVFAGWAMATGRQAILDEHLGLLERLTAQMQARASTGEESGLASRRVMLAALEVQAEAAKSEASAVRATATATVWNREIAPNAQPERPPLPAVSDTLITPLRADLVALRAKVEQADWQRRLAGRFFQFPELAFGWQKIRDDVADFEGPVLQISWPLPLFDRQQPERVAAAARLDAARARLEFAETRAHADLTAAHAAYTRLREEALSGLETAGEGRLVVESATATFRLGESRLTDLLETLRSVLSARLAALDLYVAALQAHRDLEIAAGRPLGSNGGS